MPIFWKDKNGKTELLFSISEIVARSGLSVSLINKWEKADFIVPTFVDSSAKRWFSTQYIDHIVKCYNSGVPKEKWNELWHKELTETVQKQ